MKSLDKARKTEAKEELLMLPIAALLLVLMAGIYVVLAIPQLEFMGTTYFGVSKALWFLNIVLIGGICLLVGVLSVALLLLLFQLLMQLSSRIKPWRAVAVVVCLLLVCLLALQLMLYFDKQIASDVYAINLWFENRFGWLSSLVEMIVIFIAMGVSGFVLGLAIQVGFMPANAQSLAKEATTVNRSS